VALNLQRLTEEHDRLQIRTSKLQKQLSETVAEYEERIRLLQEENEEVRGNLEFISIERNVYSELVTDLEKQISAAKAVRSTDLESLQELASQAPAAQRDIAHKM
jgi:chromosome segregation ATPase